MESERSEPDAAAPTDVAADLWGDRALPPVTETDKEAPPAIWGADPEAPPADPDPSRQWIDVWGDDAPVRSPDAKSERPQPPRFTLPEMWTAAPKPRPPWRLRFRRR